MFRYERKRGERKERVNVQNYTTGRGVGGGADKTERERRGKEEEKEGGEVNKGVQVD